MYDKLTVIKGRLSTNYNYSHDIREFRNWEPDLNVSVNSFSIIMINENDNLRKKILRLTKPEKVKTAINFIVENTNLNF
ncbi:hypothetical protein GKZ90_0016060 [Flavobacterium sp. MC2016-06]|uniref:hypothetical protein n=1 Tax=Flavobacterium sp. MC2016-06 TaxID=2676308 RepID=UPI0012BAB721|nr:hypothetical protein [Flavobacterium sp. MC2016-06]MBU3860253.1 hypothetical protein [Flavobacterium sp. MC2016-06]